VVSLSAIVALARSGALATQAAVERREGFSARGHVLERPNPHETVGLIEVAELADDLHPDGFLTLDEFGLEQIDQHIPLARMERVLPEFDDGQGCRLRFYRNTVAREAPPQRDQDDQQCSDTAESIHAHSIASATERTDCALHSGNMTMTTLY
jgi:hypothetical protein